MLSVLNRYVPGRVFVLLAFENALITIGMWTAAKLLAQIQTRQAPPAWTFF